MKIDPSLISKTKYQILKPLGQGADGEVFSLVNDDTKVLKISTIFNTPYQHIDDYIFLFEILKSQKSQPHPATVCIFDFGMIEKTEDSLSHFQVMEKLIPLSEDEIKIFYSIIKGRGGFHQNSETIKSICDNCEGFLSFDKQKINQFVESISTLKFKYFDYTPNNIMKDSLGNFKLIDLDRINFK